MVTQRGIVIINQSHGLGVNVDLLLPNGVTQVKVSNHNGTTSMLAVSNNVGTIQMRISRHLATNSQATA